MHKKPLFLTRNLLLILGVSTLSSCFNPPLPLGLDILKNDYEITQNYIFMGEYLDTNILVSVLLDDENHEYLNASIHFDQGVVFGWYTIPPHYMNVNLENGKGVYINDEIQYEYQCEFNFDTGSVTPFLITRSTQTITSEDSEKISGFLFKVASEVYLFIKEAETARLKSFNHIKNTLVAQGYTLVKQDKEAKTSETKVIYDELFYQIILREYYSGYQTQQPIDLKIYVLKSQEEATKLYHFLRNVQHDESYFYRTGNTVVVMEQANIYFLLRN